MTTDPIWITGNLLASHYELGGTPEDAVGRKLLLAFGHAVLRLPEVKDIVDRYGLSFEEVCVVCETAWGLMPNPCLRWRASIQGSPDEDARMLASTALFLDVARLERIAKAATSQSNTTDAFSGFNRTLALSKTATHELRLAAEEHNRQFGVPNFKITQQGGYKVPPSGCLGLLVALTIVTFIFLNGVAIIVA